MAGFDKIGCKPVIVTGPVIFSIGIFLAAGAHKIEWVIVGRIIQGMGESLQPSLPLWPT